jgi:predicted transcriptional regulator
MTTVTIGVASAEDSKKRFVMAMESGQPQGEFISFHSMEALWGALTPKRWDLIQALLGKGPTGIRELARLVDRDVKAVHTDAQALVACGVIRLDEDTLNDLEIMAQAINQYVEREKDFIREVERGIQAADERRLMDHASVRAKWEAKRAPQVD